ncbi:MAG: C2H2-type zinc finger protein, partial [Kistimonas sp.]|nr:C2H2-type zinc finger protein [Kistimonas sp.]
MESCPVRFARRATARHHVFSRHTATRTFVCPIQDCVKRFKDKKNLDQHLLGHSGEKPFPCPVEGCEKRFTRQTYI